MLLRRVIEHVETRNWTAVALDYFIRLQRDLRIARELLEELGALMTIKVLYMIRTLFYFSAMVFASACSVGAPPEREYADEFMANLAAHCGKAYEGKLVSTDDVDADIAAQKLVMHVRTCQDDTIRIPFHVGDDRSRTWVITRTEHGLRLKHDHRHEDGEEDTITQYGGDSAVIDNATRLEFPVDEDSIELFNREGLSASVTNVWALELTDAMFAYELNRENRHFRVEFDTTIPVSPPPPPWGAE